MAVDLSVFERQKTVLDQQQLQEAFNQKKQMMKLQELATVAELQKAMQPKEFDVDKIGKIAYVKAAQGLPLDANESASLQYITNKSNSYNPVTGNMEQKIKPPTPINGFTQSNGISAPNAKTAYTPQQNAGVIDVFEGDTPAQPVNLVMPQKDEWQLAYEAQLAAAKGNPKLQQSIKQDFAKTRVEMNENQAKAAGFADRMIASNPIIKKTTPARLDATQVGRASIPLIGNLITSGDYQSFNQAQRDFINAQLRRESGAVISPEEFDNAEKQYFPKVGDDDKVILQKEANRNNAVNAMQRSAGAAYKPPLDNNKNKESDKKRLKYNPATGEFE